MIIQCECPCGQEFEEFDKWGRKRRFIYGHQFRGKKHSPETIQKISIAHKKENLSDETIKNMSIGQTGKKLSPKTKQLISIATSGENNPFFGKHHSPKTKQLMSENRKGKYCGEEHPNYGKTFSDATRQRMSKDRKGKQCGENNPSWKGGISKEPYCQEWTPWLKEEIKERDNFRCQNPDCSHKSNNLIVHHINYNKKNCSVDNLITLCNSCNGRANINREYWQEFYNNIINKEVN